MRGRQVGAGQSTKYFFFQLSGHQPPFKQSCSHLSQQRVLDNLKVVAFFFQSSGRLFYFRVAAPPPIPLVLAMAGIRAIRG